MIGINSSRSGTRELLLRAKEGDRSQVGTLLNAYRNYLNIIADRQLDRKLRARVSPSDIVQETMLEAHRDFGQFRGTSEREFAGWLRKILANTLARVIEKHVLARKRDVRRDVPLKQLAASIEQSTAFMQLQFAAPGDSPSFDARRRERATILAAAISELPDSQREVLLMRNMQSMKFREIAAETGRSVPATKMLWMRAVKQLRKLYGDRDVG